MPAMTDDPSRVHITDPTSANDDEVDLSIDKNRIRKVCWYCSMRLEGNGSLKVSM